MIPKSVARQSFSYFFAFSFILFIVLEKTNAFANAGIDWWVPVGGTVILFIATALSFWLSERSLQSKNPQAPIRSMYGSFMIKFFLIAVAAFIYIMVEKKNVNKPALMICMGLYLVYTALEVTSLQKILKQKKNAKEGSPS
jgi:hypothetical protein